LGEVLPLKLTFYIVVGLIDIAANGVGEVLSGGGKFKRAHGVYSTGNIYGR
jgi:hypothetical protein